MVTRTSRYGKPTASAKKSVTKPSPSTTRGRPPSADQIRYAAMLDETLERLDTEIAQESSALDALLSRMAQKAA